MARLAVNGGEKAAAELSIPDWPQVTDKSREYVQDCLESGEWCRIYDDANWVEQFETEFADYQEADHAIAVNNGTVALELALRMVGVEPGDEVLVPAYTFIATASAVTSLGAVPRFVDVDPETHNIDPDSVAESITEDTVGIIGVHFGGYPIDFDAILPHIEEHDLFLVEDAAHARGTEWRGEKVGTIGDVGAFSCQQEKSLSGGEGGVVITDGETLAEQGDLLHNIGRVPGEPGYKHYALASNYRLPELQGALLSAQLEKLPEETEYREQTGAVLASELRSIEGIKPKPADDRITARGYESFSFNYEPSAFEGLERDRFIEALEAEGVPAGAGYRLPLTKQRAFAREQVRSLVPSDADVPLYQNQYLPGTEKVIQQRVSLRHRLLLADETEIRLIPKAVRKIQRNANELVTNGGKR